MKQRTERHRGAYVLTPREMEQIVAEMWEWTPKQMQRRIDRLEREVRQYNEQ